MHKKPTSFPRATHKLTQRLSYYFSKLFVGFPHIWLSLIIVVFLFS